MPWIVAGELLHGAHRAQCKEHQLALVPDFPGSIQFLLPDRITALRYGEIKAELSLAGTPVPENDIWIAAIARQKGLPLAARDAHFKVVRQLETLAW